MMNSVLLAYIGPETVLPLVSVLAAVLGAILMFWQWIISSLSKGLRFVFNRSREESPGGPVDLDERDDQQPPPQHAV